MRLLQNGHGGEDALFGFAESFWTGLVVCGVMLMSSGKDGAHRALRRGARVGAARLLRELCRGGRRLRW